MATTPVIWHFGSESDAREVTSSYISWFECFLHGLFVCSCCLLAFCLSALPFPNSIPLLTHIHHQRFSLRGLVTVFSWQTEISSHGSVQRYSTDTVICISSQPYWIGVLHMAMLWVITLVLLVGITPWGSWAPLSPIYYYSGFLSFHVFAFDDL